ncbi:maltokinase N-terminal cap-like domain-containing protein [Herbiconiux sp. SYSU D00978]|uniref:maltokinase N-terminal cap-like domain-containing protein n=1 Tax=Herbiconiux sp. SYSU D00978 TaxID=2812562 RepID=UPI0027DC5D90|nr:phosphotransferase [Herbiconiux sp. SYSU D00978]
MTELPDGLAQWMGAQRWYGAKGREPRPRRVGGWRLPYSAEAACAVHLVLDESVDPPVLYQVPLTTRSAPLADREDALITRSEAGYVYDGPQDPAFARALLAQIASDAPAVPEGASADGHAAVPLTLPEELPSRVLRGEQSNTSIIFDLVTARDSGIPAICKVFRVLHHGENPDVVLQSAIAGAGSDRVPLSLGHVSAEWDDPGRPSGTAVGHVAFAQEFLPGTQDAWRVATAAVAEQRDFTAEARDLGVATAEVHAVLAEALPTVDASRSEIDGVLASMRRRLATTSAEVAEIRDLAPRIEQVFAAAADARWPAMQRIHGDYHLGQVLLVPDRGWVLLDFEGEPLRPMTERALPDSPMRDVAGMLRSFDYAAGSYETEHGLGTARDWAAATREAFLDGYIERSGWDVRADSALLGAFELDKAVYEGLYEVRNRPDWLPISVEAVRRLAA